ncbi:hypothetical protein [Bacillus cereus]|uniref:hypothetical protein n=1 Tax=Bacillus cereus group TaxID=86661 RepID=UPI0024054F86|nr:hypothetical protein [Bacillus cereus]MDF9530607.1 hypothetical protein [Bacillus cereus]MDG1578881.1 hypothetical protein [Bacillus cereus]
MMKKELSNRKLVNRLNKKVNTMFSKKEQETIEWMEDTEDKISYSWNYFFKGYHHFLAINKRSGSITHGSCGVSK